VLFAQLAMMAAAMATSDKFGVPVTEGEDRTASGMPLTDNPDLEAAEQWQDDLINQFRWMFTSEAMIEPDSAPDVLKRIGAAFDGDMQAEAELVEISCG
jgi:hypothetical protein